MKGKKFNAAEKHFKEKELVYTRQIKELKGNIEYQELQINNLLDQNTNLNSLNLKLSEEITLLKEACLLTDAELDTMKKHKIANEVLSSLVKHMIV